MAEGTRANRRRRGFPARAFAVTLAVALSGVGAGLGVAEAGAAPETHVVTIEGMRFNPESLTVNKGDRVVWINKDLFPHTATSGAKAFDSHSIAPEASWSFVARAAGDYAYGCALHPTMKGRLTVR